MNTAGRYDYRNIAGLWNIQQKGYGDQKFSFDSNKLIPKIIF